MQKTLKACTRCGLGKPIGDFPKNGAYRKNQCKTCVYAYGNSYRKFRTKNDEAFRLKLCEYAKASRKRNAEVVRRRERIRAKKRNADPAYKAYLKAYHAKYAPEYWRRNKQKLTEAFRVWSTTSTGRALRSSVFAKRRMRTKAQSIGVIRGVFIESLFSTGKCFWCGVAIDAKSTHIDHKMPLAKGGAHCESNLVASCVSCNLRKGTKLPEEFAKQLAAG